MSGPHRFNPTVLREYDIRGIVGETLSKGDAYALGRSFGTVVRRNDGKTACVGYDGRLTSPELEAAVVSGLADCGVEVWRVGIGPTPMLYFATLTLKADAGVMVTGSHNPPTHNGFKMMLGKAAFFGAAIQELGKIAAEGAYATGTTGAVRERSVFDAYVERLTAAIGDGGRPPGRPLTVAWDAGNGAAGRAMVALTARLPGRHILLNEAIDGRFPAHHPDPTVAENLVQLQAAVREHKCDLGFAFDGDADRLGAVDGSGRIVLADQMMVLFAREVLRERPGATIIADVKSSQVLFDEIARAGGKPLMWQTGHSLIKSKMVETGAPLAGEFAAHIFFADHYLGFDDALYAAVRLLGLVARADESLAQMRDKLPSLVNTPEARFECAENRKFAIIKEIKERLQAAGAEVNDIDGVRVQAADGWWLLRASNTQDLLVARCESTTAAGLDRLKRSLAEALQAAGQTPPDW
ncbi:MAG TPA: phosphomannomutase/phosphoglucomutase [Candidatus Angelobacter sp.]|nr:phosphomannomutase/phosphoglucomutase [Candidatus Angelobacter sp.]